MLTQADVSRWLPPDARRTVCVRVADVPLATRRQAAQVAAREEPEPLERLRIRLIAENPGDLVAWVAP